MRGILTAFENRSNVSLEIRIFLGPKRPDHFERIITIEPGETRELETKYLCYGGTELNNLTLLMIFMDGVYSRVSLTPGHVIDYAKISCDTNCDGVAVRGVRVRVPGFRRLRGFSSFLNRMNFRGEDLTDRPWSCPTIYPAAPKCSLKLKTTSPYAADTHK